MRATGESAPMEAEVRPSVSVMIPAIDEDESLRRLVPAVQEVLTHRSSWHEVVVVTEADPPQERREMIEELGARLQPQSRLRGGLGDALNSGIRALASTDLTIIMDGDGSHRPETISRLLAADPEADVVIASRYVVGGETEDHWIRRLLSRIVNLTYRVVTGVKCRDVSTNFKRFRTQDLRRVELQGIHYDAVQELFFAVMGLRDGAAFLEIPDSFLARGVGDSKRALSLLPYGYARSLIRLATNRVIQASKLTAGGERP